MELHGTFVLLSFALLKLQWLSISSKSSESETYFMNQLKYHNLLAVNDTRIRATMYLFLKSIVRQNDLVKISICLYHPLLSSSNVRHVQLTPFCKKMSIGAEKKVKKSIFIYIYFFTRMERLVYILAMVILTTMFISTLACPPSCKDTGDSCMPDRPPPPTLNDDQRQAVQNDMQR